MRSTPPRAPKGPNDEYTRTRDNRQLSSGERGVLRQLVAQYVSKPDLAGPMLACLEAYLEDILHWTQDSNLVAQNDLGRLASRHAAESLAVLPLLDRLAPATLVDIGSGAGFPAIPIQIARPDLAVTVVESRRRKGLFLKRVVEGLELENATVILGRAENLGAEGAGPFDVATARAVAVIGELLPWLTPVIRPGGHAVLFKGSSHPEELAAWAKLGDPHWKHVETVPVPDRHLHFVVFERQPN
jgi:16S rRNA (guanine527-N7)-methyltransferase